MIMCALDSIAAAPSRFIRLAYVEVQNITCNAATRKHVRAQHRVVRVSACLMVCCQDC